MIIREGSTRALLISMGRLVTFFCQSYLEDINTTNTLASFYILQVFKPERSDGAFLFVKPGFSCWAVSSSLGGERANLSSVNAGQACPAHSRKSIDQDRGLKDWQFKDTKEGKSEWKEEGVGIKCSVHDN